MAIELKEFLPTHKTKKFVSTPHYIPSGDYLTFYLRDERCYAERVDDILTVYRSIVGRDFVGCEIKGVQRILDAASSFGVHLSAGKLTLGFLFLVGMTLTNDESQRHFYYELKDMVKDIAIDDLHLV